MNKEKGPFPVWVDGAKVKENDKTRSFGAQLQAFVVAHNLWNSSSSDPLRPVLAIFFTTTQGEGAFRSNLDRRELLRVHGLGSKDNGHPMEFMKSVDYVVGVQRYAPVYEGGQRVFTGGSIITVAIKEFVEEQPTLVDSDTIAFLLSVQRSKLVREQQGFSERHLDKMIERFPFSSEKHGTLPYERETILAESRRFVAALNARATEIPIPDDPLFGVQLLLSALNLKIALRNQVNPTYYTPSDRGDFQEVGTLRMGHAPGLAVRISQADCAKWIVGELDSFKQWCKVRRITRTGY